MLTLDETANRLYDTATGQCFSAGTRTWSAAVATSDAGISLRAAATWLQRRSGQPLKQPVSVIGPREASVEQLDTAEAIGSALGSIGFAVVCGGRQGIMEAVCRGVAAENGISIGLLPENDVKNANPYASSPSPPASPRHVTCWSPAGWSPSAELRNIIGGRAGLQFRPVLGPAGPKVAGAPSRSVDDAADAVAAWRSPSV
jgi:hypothetical protein